MGGQGIFRPRSPMLFFNEERLHFPNNHCRCFRSTRTHRGDLQSGFETFTVLIFTARPHAHTEGRVLSRGHFTFSRASLLLLWKTTSPPDSLPWNAEVRGLLWRLLRVVTGGWVSPDWGQLGLKRHCLCCCCCCPAQQPRLSPL